MTQKQISKIFILSIFILTLIGCGTTKNNKEENIEFENFIKPKDPNKATVGDFEKYLEYKEEQKRQSLLQDPHLKVNKTFAYQGDNKVITFSVYSDNGKLYLAQASKTDSAFLTEPENGIIKLKQPLELSFFGFFEIKDTTIKNTVYEKKPFKEWYGCDIGYIKNDTITLTSYYSTKKYGDYKKKWLAKTHNTNLKLIYQPNLKAIKIKNKSGFDTFRIEGFFSAERNLQEEKILHFLENAK